MIWRVQSQMPRYWLVLRSPCTVSRPRTMSSGYVALMPTMPAPAPAASRSSGVICPSPPFSCRWAEMRLRPARALRYAQAPWRAASGRRRRRRRRRAC